MSPRKKTPRHIGHAQVNARTFKAVEFSNFKSESMRLRVTPQQKADIAADAEALGVSATELLLQLHRIASPSFRKKKRR